MAKSLCYLLALVTNFDVANMSLTLTFACISEFTVACVVTEVFIYVPYTC